MEEPITRDTTVDALERRLRDAIIDGRHPVGALLPPERELAASYGVNRTTLKHAFVRLMQSGLVETRHGVGTRVRDFWRLGTAELLPVLVLRDDAWLGEIFEVRRQVGALIGALAARRGQACRTSRRCGSRSPRCVRAATATKCSSPTPSSTAPWPAPPATASICS